MMCAICRRDARGFGYAPALTRSEGPLRKLCSMRCMNITARLKGMIDPNKHEVNALGDEGWPLFGAWSAASGKNELKTTAKSWRSFAPQRIGAGTALCVRDSRPDD